MYKPGQSQSRSFGDGLEQIRLATNVPGISLTFSDKGTRYSGSTGTARSDKASPFTSKSRFEVSCLMKFFVSLITQTLARQGTLSLAKPVGHYLQELAGSYVGDHVHIEHLMSHTSGYRGLDVSEGMTKWGYSWAKLVSHLRACPQLFPAGSIFNYEHSEHVLLGEVLQRTTGGSIDRLLSELLFEPLGIDASCASKDKDGDSFVGQYAPSKEAAGQYAPIMSPAFGSFWRTSLPDMTLHLHDLVEIGEWCLQEENQWVRDCIGEQVVNVASQVTSDAWAERVPISFGRICAKYDTDLYGHNGSALGQTVALRIDMVRRRVYAVGVNAWMPYARDSAVRFARDYCESGAADFVPGSRSLSNVFNVEAMAGGFTLRELVGTYVGGYASQVVVSYPGDGSIELAAGRAGKLLKFAMALRDGGQGEFLGARNVSCVFTPHTSDGSPVLHLGVYAYKKIN